MSVLKTGCCGLLAVVLSATFLVAMASYAMSGINTSLASKPSVWCVIVDFVLVGHVYNTTTTGAQTQKMCWNACKLQPQCASANFGRQATSGDGQCEFNDATFEEFPADLRKRPGWVYSYASAQSHSSASPHSLQDMIDKAIPCWPLGTYGLLMPTDGCPSEAGLTWATGYCYHDTEDSNPGNEWSTGLHLKGPYGLDYMYQRFCMKTVDRVGDCDAEWPQGEYCVFKYGDHCPTGMLSGSIFWDDENDDNVNGIDGTVPSGQYDQDTRIDYCCMTSGSASQPIALPTGSPFYLFPYTAECQQVQGMKVSQEWFYWDGEDTGIIPPPQGSYPRHEALATNNLKIYFCYYD